MLSHASLPPRAGTAFKPQHFAALQRSDAPPGFIEVHAENYMGDGGLPHAQLAALRADHALSLHGVGLSIGGDAPLDRGHLLRLRRLCDRYDPQSFSEHLAWSSHDGLFLNDLLPLPYTEDTLRRVITHVSQVQDLLGRRLLLENPATYLQFAASTIPETEFLAEIAARTGCGLLLDVTNVLVACGNRGEDPAAYLAQFPLHRVGEIHLAGHHDTTDRHGLPLLIDDHGSRIAAAVWPLYDSVIARAGPLPTLVEWDNDVPDWAVLRHEAQKAQAVLDRAAAQVRAA
ncbi:DUF692 domain-containing protein [Ferrovibrio terrae]|uniref:UPF0276 protein FNB15_04060 n=1 Tax=Ferrovibrio terrae TaxID=2594003 RepID=A0A516GY95_9PROT|nr:DUF692 domain-containing protein [Ferrovibrio terrae]QDO96496.1 DUF692 domain-containing protein [Ferrovibrio terrae]